MKIWPIRRRVALALSHFAASCLGVGVFLFMAQRARLGAGFSLAPLGLAWAATTATEPPGPNIGLWASSLVAHRAAIAEDDFAVEAAVALALLRTHRDQGVSDGERRTLQEASGRCSSVLHAPCDDARFDQAAARRLNPPKSPKRRFTGKDGGASSPDVAPSDANPE